jgi:hypothetical protein
MSIGGYFVNDEAEKAAKWNALEELRQARQHRDAITDAMLRLGETLGDFAYALQHPKECVFEARTSEPRSGEAPTGEIVVGREQRTTARVEPTHLDWEIVSRLITDYIVTTRRIAELEPRFRDLT